MASSSSASDSQYCPRWKYDVFLSFRGIDTRKTFTGHLYEGLKNRGIFTFQDDKRLENGDSIPEELLKAIEESEVALVIFSKKYATSRWCLNELVKIMECKVKNGQKVIPVFYDVYASEVRHQTGSFAEAFTKHELEYKNDIEGMKKVKGWRTALSNAADLKGCNIHDRIESECIQELVDDVSSKLCKTSLSYLQDIVGIDTHLEKVKSLLEMEIIDVRIVGIWGMGGVGKTTIARAVFDTLSPQFQGACFLADVKETNTKEMHTLQNILLSELLRKEEKYVHNKEDGKHVMARRLHSMKVLVVLDDINHHDHWEYLAGDLRWFGSGSRIIVTTRNKQIIGKNNVVYEVTTLLEHDAIRLFNHYAFKDEAPDEHIMKLALEVVNHAKGLPLALKLWGIWLHNQDTTMWRDVVDMIKSESSSDIVQNLKISFEGLQDKEKTIFLDIACFFRGRGKDEIIKILESYDLGARIRLHGLIEKSLVFISKYDTIQMHDLIQDMGRYVVKIQKDSGKPSRIWNIEDFEDVMVNNTGSTMEVEAICCDYIPEPGFSREAMQNMKRLRILCYYPWHSPSYSEDIPIEYLPNNLCWFVWYHYPWKSFPENFNPKRLVNLDLKLSSLHYLWNETKKLPSLQRLDLSGSRSLKKTPDFKGMPNLEYLNLEECKSLEEVHHSLGCSRKLINLKLYNCESLKKFPYVNVESLIYLDLNYCSSLEKFPEILGRMKLELVIKMSYSGIRELPLSIIHLTVLDLRGMNNLVSLPSSIYKFKGLVKLDVFECSKLESLPEEIGDLEKLEYLNARYTLISRPPSSIVRLNKLKLLSFGKKKTEDGVYFVFPWVNEGLFSLEALNLSNCNLIDGGLPEDIGSLSSLKTLDLAGNNFEYLPQSIAQLSGLRSLDLSYCTKLKELTDFTGMPNLEYLDLEECKSLEEVHHSLGCSRKLIDLKLYNCESLKRFPYVNAESLEYLDLNYCSSLEKFPEILGRMKLELEITLSYSGIREVPLSIIHLLSHLTVLDWSGMNNLVSLPSSICKFKGLVKLDVSECSKLESLPEEIVDLEKLEELYGSYTQISRPPSSIVRLNKLLFLTFAKEKRGSKDGVYFVFPQVSEGLRSLEKLDLSYCNLIDGGLPEDIGCLSSLKELYLEENNFEHLPRSIAQLSALQSLDLSDCKRLKELPNFMGMPNLETLVLSSCNLIDGGLPEDIGCLSSLKELDLSGNNFEYLPQSIAQLSGLQSLSLSDCKRLKELPNFMGMPNLETLELSSCNLIDGGLPEDIGSLSSLKKLGLAGNNFEHLPLSIAQLSDLQSLYLSDCKRLTQLPEIPQQLDIIDADWSNDSICNSLFQNISSLQHDISASESLSLRVFTSWLMNIPSWFHHQGVGTSVSVDLPENWYVSDKFLGFAVCYSGKLIDITAHLIPLCDDGMSSMTQKLALSNNSKTPVDSSIHFFLVPLAGLWDASNANGKTPNDYGCIGLYSPGEMKEFGVRLLYKDEPELCIGIRKNKYEEASCSSSKKQVQVPLSSKTTKIHSFIRRLAKPMKGTCFLRR